MFDVSSYGLRSPLVRAKLGYDLRAYLAATFGGPLPPRLQALSDELAGYADWRDVSVQLGGQG